MNVISTQQRRYLRLLVLISLAATAAGCSDSTDSASGDRASGSPHDQLASASPRFTGRWTKLSARCPTLTGDVARSLHVTGEGRPGKELDQDSYLSLSVSCSWGATDDPVVSAIVTIDRNDGAATAEQEAKANFDKEWKQQLDQGWIRAAQPVPGIADIAQIGVYRGEKSIILSVLSSNAEISIFLDVPQLSSDNLGTELLRYQDTMRALASDLLDDLR